MRHVLLALCAFSCLAMWGCPEEGSADPDAGATDTVSEVGAGQDVVGTADYAAEWAKVRDIISGKCSRCHSADRLSTYRRLETHAEVTALRGSILDKIGSDPPRGLQMPVAPNHVGAEGCEPTHAPTNDKRLTADEFATFSAFIARDDHRDYTDTFPVIEAPSVPLLADAVEYTSSQFDVLNDGFITPPDGAPPGYMEEFGYDERDFDQMEDDWFCIEFDPARTEAGYLTGVQVLTEIGQIFLNAQLVIDTTGGSAAAKAAADEKGTDWYRCDQGLGFSDAIPLWRTVPGGGAVELPDQTGVRFEPGWRFILRADFHTHFDAAEFNKLNQKGVIDRDAGTMTWFNSATLLARWAAPAEISRELRWMTVGPETQAERNNFVVPPGASTQTFDASLPADATASSYKVFSAEVEMGKNGYQTSLRDTSTSSCIANNSDFSPKWIEQTVYGESDAPTLTSSSQLELTCAYRNGDDEGVGWGPEGEGAVWGRKERCRALLWFYEAL